MKKNEHLIENEKTNRKNLHFTDGEKSCTIKMQLIFHERMLIMMKENFAKTIKDSKGMEEWI